LNPPTRRAILDFSGGSEALGPGGLGAKSSFGMARNLRRRELLEIRRQGHEEYLRNHFGPSYTLRIEGDEAVVRGLWGTLTVRMPRDDLWDWYALRKRGF